MGITKSFMSDDVIVHNDVEISITIWLDAEINKKVENQNAQQQLLRIVNRFKTFEDTFECEKYIRSKSSKQRILLIVNDQQGRQIIPHIHALRQIISIYIYCKDKKGNEQWTNQFSKVKGVIRRLDELISQIKIDQESFLFVDKVQSINPSAINGKTGQSKTHFTLEFAYSQLLSNILPRSKPWETDRTDLISLCKDIYKDSESELKLISEFQETYSNHKALWWYTRLTCFDHILNKALRSQDIHKIFLFQFFIHDLHQQITEYQCQNFIRVYRGQIMSYDKINSLKQSVGCFISIHTFFSTIIDRNHALDFLNTCDNSNDLHRVFFEVDADPGVVTTKPFADITEHSQFPNEGEVLFSIGSVFRITNVQQNEDQVWIIQMTLCGDDDADLKPLFKELDEKYEYYDGETAFLSFSRLLREMKKFDEAENYCHRLLRDFSSNDSLLGVLYDELAQVASSKNDYDLSDQWQQKSIQIKKKIGSDSFGNNTGAVSYSNDSKSVPDMVNFDHHEEENNWRFMDVAAENHDVLLPIEGHEKMPLVTLEEAVQPLISILPDIRRKVHTAKQNCKKPADGLTSDESAAIMLYTMEWEPQDQCLYFALNAQLRKADRKKLKPWFLYLKLILTGLSRLPSIQRTVYRGVKLNLSSKYREGEHFFWWGFSSCTKTMNVLKSDQYLGNSGIRTLFHIECMNGKDIRRHSYYEIEDEILLLPATYFEVMSSFEMAPDLHVIQLKEIKPEFPYLEPVV